MKRNPSKIANATIFGNYTGLTSGALDATTIQNVGTQQFTANAGDSLLIAFSSDVTSGYDSNDGAFNGASVLADNLELNAVAEPGGMAVAGMALVAALSARRRPGFTQHT
jgi:hypothetical protein